jgi:hypothetical protein
MHGVNLFPIGVAILLEPQWSSLVCTDQQAGRRGGFLLARVHGAQVAEPSVIHLAAATQWDCASLVPACAALSQHAEKRRLHASASVPLPYAFVPLTVETFGYALHLCMAYCACQGASREQQPRSHAATCLGRMDAMPCTVCRFSTA